MLFHTATFTLFFTVTFGLFLALRGEFRKVMLLLASWVFYGWLDWRFLVLMVGSTSADYCLGLLIERSGNDRQRKMTLAFSVAINLLFLSIFKYYDFFAYNVQAALAQAGFTVHISLLNFALPVGISFYTFQSMSYVIDVFRREIKATNSFPDYALFVSFFPHLVAGPIQRASHLLPQLSTLKNTTLPNVVEGAHIFLIGIFYKVYMADNLAKFVDMVFEAPYADGLSSLLATYCFGFQIYGDFAGYSLMAIGAAKILGINLTDNFRTPYLSSGAVDFWRRWHIALSTWFRDYLYVPLGGNRVTSSRMFINLMLVMLLCGLWHGAGWNYIVWGGFHGLLIALDHFLQRRNISAPPFVKWAVWTNLILIGWLFFRAHDIQQAVSMVTALATDFHLSSKWGASSFIKALCVYALPIMVMEYFLLRTNRKYWFEGMSATGRFAGFFGLSVFCLLFGKFDSRAFIYFAF
ncbi:MAG: MBOAT family protein [Alphaproteobacteria bacterium]|nr:MBOAT family protein [Alphaproteobacteria bacterium]